MDVLELTAGNRVIISTCAIGGTRRDISQEHAKMILETMDHCQSRDR